MCLGLLMKTSIYKDPNGTITNLQSDTNQIKILQFIFFIIISDCKNNIYQTNLTYDLGCAASTISDYSPSSFIRLSFYHIPAFSVPSTYIIFPCPCRLLFIHFPKYFLPSAQVYDPTPCFLSY